MNQTMEEQSPWPQGHSDIAIVIGITRKRNALAVMIVLHNCILYMNGHGGANSIRINILILLPNLTDCQINLLSS